MRKSYFAIIALGALVIASCQKENSADLPKVDSPVFTATLDADSDTKTVLVETVDGKKSHWESGDAIRVLNETGNAADYTTTDAGVTATFTTTTKGFRGTEFIAMYPASPAGSVSLSNKKVYKLWLKNAQTADEDGGYDPNAHIAVAYTNTNSFVFKNVVALLKISVLGTGVQNISVSSASGEKIVGNFTYNPATGEVTTNDGINYSNSSKVTLSGTFTDGTDYYIAVLPGTYSEFALSVNGITVNKKSSDVTFKSGKIYNLGSVRAPFNWGVVGKFNGWKETSPTLLYDTDGDGIYELKNHSLAGQEGAEGFKFVRVPDCNWSNAFGAHNGGYKADTELKGNWYTVYTDKISEQKIDKNIEVSDTSKNYDIYMYCFASGTWGQGLNFTVLPAGTATPKK